MKEISIRKLMGAGTGKLFYLLNCGSLVLLVISALIALPVTYLFFEHNGLTRYPYHPPVQAAEMFAGLLLVLLIAFIIIGSQTLKAAMSNPAEVLKRE